MDNDNNKKPSVIVYILKALVPYTKQNLQLAFNPSEFFNELEQASGVSRRTLIQTYARAKKKNLIEGDHEPSLTLKGRQHVQPYIAKSLDGAQLMVIFDIPESHGEQRRQLRTLLHYLGFSQVQRSVWMSPNDHTDVLNDTLVDLRLGDWVQIYEVSRIR